jgi:hypothetical protein
MWSGQHMGSFRTVSVGTLRAHGVGCPQRGVVRVAALQPGSCCGPRDLGETLMMVLRPHLGSF